MSPVYINLPLLLLLFLGLPHLTTSISLTKKTFNRPASELLKTPSRLEIAQSILEQGYIPTYIGFSSFGWKQENFQRLNLGEVSEFETNESGGGSALRGDDLLDEEVYLLFRFKPRRGTQNIRMLCFDFS